MQLMLFQSLLAATLFMGSIAATPKIPYYIITNAETPSLDRPGLTPIGRQRAESCIPTVFSQLNIGLIITCTVDRDGEEGLGCPAANQTALPLAAKLGLNITTCGTGEESNDECVHNKIHKFNQDSNQSALIVWDAMGMDDLMENADVNDAGIDDDTLGTHPDLILTVVSGKRTGQSSMNCTGIDGPA